MIGEAGLYSLMEYIMLKYLLQIPIHGTRRI